MNNERSPRIAIVVKTYPKLSETFILEELLGLERQGLEFDLFSLRKPTDERHNPETALVQAPVSYVPTTPTGRVGFRRGWSHVRSLARHRLRYLKALRCAVRWSEADERPTETLYQACWLAGEVNRRGLSHLHTHFISYPTSVIELVSVLTGVRFSISAHAKDIYLSSPGSLRRKLNSAEFTVTCTEHNREHLAAVSPPGADVRTVHHGVRLELFEPGGPAKGRPVIVAVGRLREKKGFDLLVEACARLRDAGQEFECRIIGYGPEGEALEAQILDLGLSSHVSLLGKLTRNQVIDHYRDASVVVQPCRITADGDRDGIPNVLLEAMAMEVPVVSTTVSGIPELLDDGHSGLLVPPEDVESLSNAIARLLDNPDEARRIGEYGRRVVAQNHAVDTSSAKISALLDKVAAERAQVAYVVKGYPRMSEIFIASEIYRVEQLGMRLRLFVIKAPTETRSHELVDRTNAKPQYLPPVTSLSKRPAWRWIMDNIGVYGPILVRVAVRRPAGFSRAARDAFAQSIRARKGRWPRKLYMKEFFQAAAIADQVIDDDAVRHLHAHFCHGATTVTWFAATMSGRSFSFTAHAKDIYNQDLNPAGLLARKLSAADFAATCTEANRTHLLGVNPAASVQRVYHGLNAEFSGLLESVGPRPPSSDRFEILSVGRLVEKKGLDTLVRACSVLEDSDLDFRVLIVGEHGDQSELLAELVDELGLGSKISFVGAMGQRELLEQYRRADVFCLPCRVLADGDRDGIPNVLMESMAAGLPVVSTPISGIPELVENRVNGVLVDSDDVEALAKALLELAAEPELRRSLAEQAQRSMAENFDAWSEARSMVALFEQSLDPTPS